MKTNLGTKKRVLSVAILFTISLIINAQHYNKMNDIPYRNDATGYAAERCKLDIYYPTDKKDCPVVVWYHGGGLEGGNKHLPNELVNAGYVVVSPNYRLLPKCTIDECVDDAAAALAWTFNNIEAYNGSAKKIVVSGHSAGGYLTDLLGLDKTWLAKYELDPDSIVALFPFSGQCITHYNVRREQGIKPLDPTIDKYAPLAHLRADAPPIFVISGDRETELYGRYEEQAYFWRMLKLVGHKQAYLYEMQGHDHGAMPAPAFHIMKEWMRKNIR